MHARVESPHIVGFLDLGTNSVRLLLVRLQPNGTHTVLTQQKETIRLGEGEFASDVLQPAAIDRAVLVCRKFADLARANGVEELVAVATSATREAHNQGVLLQRLRGEAGLDVHVISGREEARLIYLGVSSGIHLDTERALFIDIGGGSTELSVGDQHEHAYLDSLKLGAIRVSMRYPLDPRRPVSAKQYARLQEHVRDVAIRSLQRLQAEEFTRAFASSGTAENLGNVAARLGQGQRRPGVLTASQLREAVALLCSLPLEARRQVPGLNPDRADIIVHGAAILETLVQELGLPEVQLSPRGLRDGLLVDYLQRHAYGAAVQGLSVRARSVLQLGRRCGFDEAHAAHVARLALMLFDSAREIGLHMLGTWERELLDWAAQLHDIGTMLSYTNHQAHAYYFIRHADLLGFDQAELDIIATTVLFHRKVFPRKKHPEFAVLDPQAQEIVRVLCVCLRIAESLDRSHAGLVTAARFEAGKGAHVVLRLHAATECHLEHWGVLHHADAVEKAFKRKLTVEAACEDAEEAQPGITAIPPDGRGSREAPR